MTGPEALAAYLTRAAAHAMRRRLGRLTDRREADAEALSAAGAGAASALRELGASAPVRLLACVAVRRAWDAYRRAMPNVVTRGLTYVPVDRTPGRRRRPRRVRYAARLPERLRSREAGSPLERRDRAAWFWGAVAARLAGRELAVVLGHYRDGRELRELARSLGVSPPSVSADKRRALERLRADATFRELAGEYGC